MLNSIPEPLPLHSCYITDIYSHSDKASIAAITPSHSSTSDYGRSLHLIPLAVDRFRKTLHPVAEFKVKDIFSTKGLSSSGSILSNTCNIRMRKNIASVSANSSDKQNHHQPLSESNAKKGKERMRNHSRPIHSRGPPPNGTKAQPGLKPSSHRSGLNSFASSP